MKNEAGEHWFTCPDCQGARKVMVGGDAVECPGCNGSGEIQGDADYEGVFE